MALTDPSDGKSYYYVTGDTANEHDLALDADHKGACKVKIEVEPASGFVCADGTYYANISLADSSQRLGAEVTGSGNAAYVATAQDKNVYVQVTVSGSTFAKITKYAYVSLTGTDGVDETSKDIKTTDWTFGWADAAGTNFVAAANS